ncbi:MAG: hypothetical protein ACTSVB_04160 [Candidatus Heimdallarchaeaceae archaeon]
MNKDNKEEVRDFGLIFYIWLLVALGALAFGVFALYDLYQSNQGIIDWIVGKVQGLSISDLSGYTVDSATKYWVIGTIGVLFLFGIILAYIEVWFMSYLGAETVIGTIFGVPLLLLGGGIYSVIFIDPIWIGLVILAPTVFLIVIVLLVSRRIILGAKIFETSCEAVNENRRTILPIIFFALFSIVLFILGTGASVWAAINIGDILTDKSSWVQTLVFFLIIYVYLNIYWTMLYFTDAINICIFKRWNNYKDASIRKAFREIMKVKGSIVLFGTFMAFFNWIVIIVQYFAAKKIKETSKFYKVWTVIKKILTVVFFIFVILIKWLYKILKFLNYYTLTIIVVEKQGFIKSIARSSELSLDSGADIIIEKTGVNIAKGLFIFMTFSIFTIGGFFIGYYWLGYQILGSVTNIAIFGIAVSIMFFFFGYLPMTAVLRPISTAYKTILFFYLTDPFRGKSGRRTQLSEDIQKDITRVKERVLKDYDKESRESWIVKAETEEEPVKSN